MRLEPHGAGGGLIHVVDYDVRGWPQDKHNLKYTCWQDEREGEEAETNRDREIEREYNGEEWLGVMDVEAEIAREEGADVAGSRSSRDERSRTRGERSGEQGDGVGPEQRRNRSRDERAELVWDALEEELGKRRKRARDDTVSQTLVKIRAKVRKKVHDAEALLEQMTE